MQKIYKSFLRLVMSDDIDFYIWGAGIRGKKALHRLRKLGKKHIYFIDSNENIVGTEVERARVYDRSVMDNKPEMTVTIVSPLNTESLYKELSGKYKNVFPTQCVDFLDKVMFLSYEDYGFSDIFNIDHFYSCYPDIKWCDKYEKRHESKLFDINMREGEQLRLLNSIRKNINSLPKWSQKQGDKYRYYFPNGMFEIGDAWLLHCMLRTVEPHKVVEVGSGFSSAVTLDTNEFYFNNELKLSFIEPYPERLKRLLRKNDKINLQECILQDADISQVLTLNENDVLFIDSSHVSKRNSDVNLILFEILPQLQSGVYIHFHDIFNGFEYPFEWAKQGRTWNEDYLLRAFLMNNDKYEIVFFNPFMQKYIEKDFPYDGYNPGGSLWIRKK